MQNQTTTLGQMAAAAVLTLGVGYAPAALAQTMPYPPANPPAKRIITQGLAKTVNENLFKCAEKVTNHRISAVGTITAKDGTEITVPAKTNYETGPKLPDLFNECNKVTPQKLSDVKLDDVPIVEIDKDGEVVTGYIMADNYYELYVNGKLIGVDPVPFTPFNSNVVRFRAKKPYTYALLLVDWEEKLGLGMEKMPYNPWHSGDGGIIAKFSDGTVTDSSWKAQSFYIAPLAHPDDVVELGNIHDTSKLGRVHPIAKLPTCKEYCFAIHYPIPDGWQQASFDDSKWPRAYEYTDADVGVGSLTGYWRYPEAFLDARWMWTINLVFDNLVLARKTVR
ncbi:MAG: hypothetical protein J0H62_05465 [Rhizobiales bacterium]|nr:hypothetical protein [Hyphomicrobiales bacterium]